MQFERLLNLIEDAPDTIRADVAGNLFHFAITQTVNVKLGTQLLQSAGERQAVLSGFGSNPASGKMRGQKLTQNWIVVRRCEGNALVNPYRLEAAVQDCS